MCLKSLEVVYIHTKTLLREDLASITNVERGKWVLDNRPEIFWDGLWVKNKM